MTKKIAVIGGGWYGCHIASSLIGLGFQVTLIEQSNRLLNEASGNNQFRLHLGFHYPRHATTRIQSRDGFVKFLERYPTLSIDINENIYAVPQKTSLLDYDTFKLVMTSTGIPYQADWEPSLPLKHVEGTMKVKERVLLIENARSYFTKLLGTSLLLGKKVTNVNISEDQVILEGDRFDYAIDATWGHFVAPRMEVTYEPTLLLYFKSKPNMPALTFVDGPLYSVYPTENNEIYTLSSVPHTPLCNCATAKEARHINDTVDMGAIKKKVEVMTKQVDENVPYFRDMYEFIGPQLSIKTKPTGMSADRSCYVERRGRMFLVMSGKIDTVFFATERIISMIEMDYKINTNVVASRLSETIQQQIEKLNMNGIL